jgi:hypothetical protein
MFTRIQNLRKSKIIISLFVVLFIFLILVTAFFLRSPVLIVTDNSFIMLYGPERLDRTRRSISRELFRQVIPVTVSESAGPDLVAFAVESSSKKPWAVLFPFRYYEGARLYKEGRLETAVLVVGGRGSRPVEEELLVFANSDTRVDLYRAGLCAALLAGDKRVLFFTEGLLLATFREAFMEGLRAQGHLEEPVFMDSFFDYHQYPDIGCVVVAGPASRFFQRNLDIPVILFSWIDPALSPRSVKVVFDDSPWALATKILKSLPPPGHSSF